MIDRINLIDSEPLKLTYTRIFQIVGGVAFVCALIFGLQFGWGVYQNKKIAALQIEIASLNEQKRSLEKAAPPKIESGQHMEIRTTLSNMPKWTLLLEEVSGKLPSNMWLKSLVMGMATKGEEKKDPKKDAKNAAPAPAISVEGSIVLQGNANNAADIATYAQSLGESKLFENVNLKSAEKADTNFVFVIDAQVSVAARTEGK